MRVASRALGIVPSQIRRITDRARPTSLHLGLRQPDTALHPHVTAAIQDYLASGRAPPRGPAAITGAAVRTPGQLARGSRTLRHPPVPWSGLAPRQAGV